MAYKSASQYVTVFETFTALIKKSIEVKKKRYRKKLGLYEVNVKMVSIIFFPNKKCTVIFYSVENKYLSDKLTFAYENAHISSIFFFRVKITHFFAHTFSTWIQQQWWYFRIHAYTSVTALWMCMHELWKRKKLYIKLRLPAMFYDLERDYTSKHFFFLAPMPWIDEWEKCIWQFLFFSFSLKYP